MSTPRVPLEYPVSTPRIPLEYPSSASERTERRELIAPAAAGACVDARLRVQSLAEIDGALFVLCLEVWLRARAHSRTDLQGCSQGCARAVCGAGGAARHRLSPSARRRLQPLVRGCVRGVGGWVGGGGACVCLRLGGCICVCLCASVSVCVCRGVARLCFRMHARAWVPRPSHARTHKPKRAQAYKHTHAHAQHAHILAHTHAHTHTPMHTRT